MNILEMNRISLAPASITSAISSLFTIAKFADQKTDPEKKQMSLDRCEGMIEWFKLGNTHLTHDQAAWIKRNIVYYGLPSITEFDAVSVNTKPKAEYTKKPDHLADMFAGMAEDETPKVTITRTGKLDPYQLLLDVKKRQEAKLAEEAKAQNSDQLSLYIDIVEAMLMGLRAVQAARK